MKQLLNLKQIAAILLLAGATSCSENKTQSPQISQTENDKITTFGQPSKDTISHKPDRIFEKLVLQQNFNTAVIGKVKYCSKDSGNWLILEGDSTELLVEVKDNAFVLPTNLEGKLVLVNGKASYGYHKNGELTAKIIALGVELVKLRE
jgi:hypothetical protein